LQDGGEIDLKLLGEALSGENEVLEVDLVTLHTVKEKRKGRVFI